MDDYPRRLGVFPLPDVVLFPGARLPLHVFEPRYRALLADALGRDGRFTLAVLKPGWEEGYEGSPGVHRWACAGRVVQHEELPDGCSDLVLLGERVVRIVEFVQDRPFRLARVEPRPDDGDFARSPGAPERLEELRRLLDVACPGASEALELRLSAPPEDDGGLELLSTLAATFPVPLEQKLEWLAAPGSLARWKEIRRTLQALGKERCRKARVMTRYSDLAPEDPQSN